MMNENTVRIENTGGMSEAELFKKAEYQPDASEQTGYSNYSYWRSVWKNFISKKMTVAMLVVFLAVFIFHS